MNMILKSSETDFFILSTNRTAEYVEGTDFFGTII